MNSARAIAPVAAAATLVRPGDLRCWPISHADASRVFLTRSVDDQHGRAVPYHLAPLGAAPSSGRYARAPKELRRGLGPADVGRHAEAPH